MSWFARIEETCAAFIERAFANMFPSDLEPAQIARTLVAVMEPHTPQNESPLVAPSLYTVYVNPRDYERLSPHRAYLEQEWSALLRDVAARVGIRFMTAFGAPAVTLRKDENVLPGAIDVDIPERTLINAYLLRVVKGMPPGAEFRVNGTARLGRSRDNDIFIVDPSVSRHHAVLEMRDGKLVVRDTGSTNGTFVNGERVQLRTLQPGDVVAFGKTQLRVEVAQ
jgi:hypothetical protein